MTATTIGVAQGASALGFEVIDHFGRGADPFNVCATAVDRGELVFFTGANTVSVASGNLPAGSKLAGFIESTVVTDMSGLRIDYHGQYALASSDTVAIWRQGRYRVTAVSGVVGNNVLVYPAAGGAVSATQSGSDPAVGICRVGNGSTSGGPIEVEINLVG